MTNSVIELVFWGATGQAKVLYEALGNINFHLLALVDNRDVVSPYPKVPVLKGEAGLDAWLVRRGGGGKNLFSVVAIGGAHGRHRLDIMGIFQERGLSPLTIVHSSAFVASDAVIGKSCQILAQAAVCTHVRLGNGVIVNTAASVDHDCIIGNGVHLAPGVHLAGEVIVDEGAFIGTGAIVLPRIHVGKYAMVGAGAVVTKDVPPNVTVVGNPAYPSQKTYKQIGSIKNNEDTNESK